MNTKALSRRKFLQTLTENAGNSLVILSMPSLLVAGTEAQAASSVKQTFSTLSAVEAAECEAIAARIIPTDELPGASEAGVVYFIDNILGASGADALPGVRDGLLELQLLTARKYGSARFHTLTGDQQDSLLREIQETAFFDTIRYLTLAGMFTHPSYGGNRNLIGWQLIGFEDRHMWEPPFGYYDAEYMETGE